MKTTLKVNLSQIMQEELVVAQEFDSVQTVIEKMTENKVGSVIVVDRQEPVGVITERDIVILLGEGRCEFDDLKAGEVMSSPIITINQNEAVGLGVARMLKNNVRRLIVTKEEGGVVGIVTIRDLVTSVHDSFLGLFDS